jgi:hypothetical protein
MKYTLIFNVDSITVAISRDVPKLCEIKREPSLKDYKLQVYVKKCKKHLHPSENPTIASHLTPKGNNLLKDTIGATKYMLNYPFLNDFMEQIHDIFELTLDEILNDVVLLKFLSELYKINLVNLKENSPIDFFKCLIKYLISFENTSRFSTVLYNDLTVIKDHQFTKFYTALSKHISHMKYFINELLLNLVLFYRAKFFLYDFFVDFRFRVYLDASCLLVTNPVARTFISFYETEGNITIDNKPELLLELEKQINSVLIDPIAISNLPRCCQNLFLSNIQYKFGEGFHLIMLVNDYFNVLDNKVCYSFYSLDCSTSGIQNFSSGTKNKILAQASNLNYNVNISEINKQGLQVIEKYISGAIPLRKQIYNILGKFRTRLNSFLGPIKALLGEIEERIIHHNTIILQFNTIITMYVKEEANLKQN